MPKAAILGCGPAGLFAAYACELSGVEPFIFSQAGPSRLYGSQFLGKQLPYAPASPTQGISVTMQGTEDEYRTKVYGEDYTGPVSPSLFVGEHIVHDIRAVYSMLWNNYCPQMAKYIFDARNYGLATAKMLGEFDFVFSSIPIKTVCAVRDHTFEGRTIYAMGDAPDLDVRCPVRVPDGTIIYCGTSDRSWYRASNIFGHCTAEWARKPPVSGVAKVTKPLTNDCDCYPEVVRIGRYGEWKKGVLAIDAFTKTMNTLKNGVQSVLF